MSAIAFETLLPQLGQLTPIGAERWIAAALAVAAALHEHDAGLYPIDPTRLPVAERLHEAWRGWAEEAESLLLRINSLQFNSSKLGELQDEIGRTQSMLGMPPKFIAQRHQQALRGDVRTLEEVRSGLRPGHRR
jgi:hypothetical protein